MVLYGARAARKDLLKAVSNLARFISKWSLECDAKLQRLMDYIHSTLKWREINWIGDTVDNVTLDLFPDADFGGCQAGSKSTSGCYHCWIGKNTRFGLSGSSKARNVVSHSTPEAEIVSADCGIRTIGLPSHLSRYGEQFYRNTTFSWLFTKTTLRWSK